MNTYTRFLSYCPPTVLAEIINSLYGMEEAEETSFYLRWAAAELVANVGIDEAIEMTTADSILDFVEPVEHLEDVPTGDVTA